MASANYAKYRQAAESWSTAGLAAAVDLATDTIKIIGYTAGYAPNMATDQFLSALGANTVGTGQVFTFGSNAGGVYKPSNSPAFAGVASTTIVGWVVYKDTGSAATSPLISRYDGTCPVTAALAAAGGATSIAVDPVPYAIASGASITFGAVVATLTAPAAIGARTLTVSALSGAIAQGVTATNAPVSGANLPIVVASTPITVTVTPDATLGLFTI